MTGRPPEVLDRFIQETLDAYEPPPASRKGIPRGEKRGFPRQKYHATLLALTDQSVRDQAERLRVSYDVLKNWRSEPEFQNKVRKHQTHFVRWLATKELKKPGSDWPSSVLTFLTLSRKKPLLDTKRHWTAAVGKQREETNNRLTLSLLMQALEKSASHPKTWKELEAAALSHVIELLQHRNQTIRYRQDIAKLLSTIKDGLGSGKQ